MHNGIRLLAQQIIEQDSFQGISRENAQGLLALGPEYFMDIMALARMALARFAQQGSSSPSRPFTCGIISAKTGRCSENCSFCAQSAHHKTNAPVHGLVDYDTLAARAEELSRNGVARFGIVTSGHRLTAAEYEKLCAAIARLRVNFPISICASLGSLSPDQALMLKEAGVKRYHHNLETSRGYYPQICTTHSYEERVRTVEIALDSGLECCSGGIFGLGESWEDRLEMAEIIRDLDVDCVPMNFLTPIPGTPLEHRLALPVQEALLCLSIFRLMLPTKGIIVCGGREFCLGNWQSQLFNAGANGMMVGNYLVTSGSSLDKDRQMLEILGMGEAMQQRQLEAAASQADDQAQCRL